jgi:hypothetical protein
MTTNRTHRYIYQIARPIGQIAIYIRADSTHHRASTQITHPMGLSTRSLSISEQIQHIYIRASTRTTHPMVYRPDCYRQSLIASSSNALDSSFSSLRPLVLKSATEVSFLPRHDQSKSLNSLDESSIPSTSTGLA